MNLFLVFKRIFDIIFSIVFMVVFSPVYIIFAFLIFWEDKHWPFYTQTRVGKNGEPFTIYKFRSMVHNADEILFKKDKELYKKMRTGNNKAEDDYRRTKVGKFIRKYSIDEMPPMLNVLLGQQSVVGPRALRPDEYRDYESRGKSQAEKLKIMNTVKPGVTGYWQVNGRSNVDFDNRMDMDCYYAKNISFMLDLKIIVKTPIAVVIGEGAY